MAGESAAEIARRQRERAEQLRRSAEAWERGAEGERLTGAELERLRAAGWTVFHDVRWPGRLRANIDHVAVGPQGVFVIDTKNWSGAIHVVDDVLYAGGRRREREVAAAAEAALAITQLLGGAAGTPVLCFVGAEPLGGWARDVMVSSTEELPARLRSQPPVLSPDAVRRIARVLNSQLVSASRSAPVSSGHRRPERMRPYPTRPALHRPRRRPGGIATPISRRLGRLVLGVVLLMVGSIVALSLIGWGLKAATSHPGSTVGDTESAGRDAGENLPVLGKPVHLPATTDHPAVVVKADKLVRLPATASVYPLPAGLHLIGVRYTIRNLGDRLWGLTPNYLQLSVLASNGQIAPHTPSTTVPGRRMLPAVFNLGPEKTRRGFVVFSVADGARPVRVSAALAYGSGGAATWLVP